MVKYANALTEVYVILNTLIQEDYEKIPQNVINAIQENMNVKYDYKIDSEKSLKDCEMLLETKQILFNLFKEYLATSEEKEKIQIIERNEWNKIEQRKQNQYSSNVFSSTKIEKSIIRENDRQEILNKPKEKFITKIINKLKSLF